MVEASQGENKADDEGVRSVELRKMDDRCPFRGWPHRYLLDGRCPATIPVLMVLAEELAGDIASREARAKVLVSVPTPIVRLGSPCAACLEGRIREREAGLKVDSRAAGPSRRGGSALRRRR